MSQKFEYQSSWSAKFIYALRGIAMAVRGTVGRGQTNSFLVYVPVSIAVLSVAVWWQLSLTRVLLLLFCIGSVIVAEVFNTAFECLAKAVTDQQDENIRDALDIASGAVLVASLFAAVVGAIIFLA